MSREEIAETIGVTLGSLQVTALSTALAYGVRARPLLTASAAPGRVNRGQLPLL
jgi:hypothetical protein